MLTEKRCILCDGAWLARPKESSVYHELFLQKCYDCGSYGVWGGDIAAIKALTIPVRLGILDNTKALNDDTIPILEVEEA